MSKNIKYIAAAAALIMLAVSAGLSYSWFTSHQEIQEVYADATGSVYAMVKLDLDENEPEKPYLIKPGATLEIPLYLIAQTDFSMVYKMEIPLDFPGDVSEAIQKVAVRDTEGIEETVYESGGTALFPERIVRYGILGDTSDVEQYTLVIKCKDGDDFVYDKLKDIENMTQQMSPTALITCQADPDAVMATFNKAITLTIKADGTYQIDVNTP